MVLNKTFNLQYMRISTQVAGMLTKTLGTIKHEQLPDKTDLELLLGPEK